ADRLPGSGREKLDERIGGQTAADRSESIDGLLDDQRILLRCERRGERSDRGLALGGAQRVERGHPDVAVGIAEQKEQRVRGARGGGRLEGARDGLADGGRR